MPSSQRPRYDWPIRMAFESWNHKPRRRWLPGLCMGPWGRYPNGDVVYQFTLEGLLAN